VTSGIKKLNAGILWYKYMQLFYRKTYWLLFIVIAAPALFERWREQSAGALTLTDAKSFKKNGNLRTLN